MPKVPTKNAKPFSTELPAEVLDALRQFASSRGEKVKDVVVLALRRHMASPPPPPVVPELPPLPTFPLAPKGPVGEIVQPTSDRAEPLKAEGPAGGSGPRRRKK